MTSSAIAMRAGSPVTWTKMSGSMTARACAAHGGAEIDANAELRAPGVANVAAGLTHGFPVSSSGSRTALGDVVGSRTQMYSLVVLTLVLAVTLWRRGVLANLPTAAL